MRPIASHRKALKANKANCSDASLAAVRDRQIKQSQKKIADRKAKLEAEKPLLRQRGPHAGGRAN